MTSLREQRGSLRPSSASRLRRLGSIRLLKPPPAKCRSQTDQLADDLESEDSEVRVRAAKGLDKLASGYGGAIDVACHLEALVRRLQDQETSVRLAVLGTLRSLVEHGQAGAVGIYCRYIVESLSDSDMAVRRKVAALCRVLAEEGGASFLVAQVPKLVQCSVGEGGLTTGLDALSAIAEAGEATAVAHAFSQLLESLSDTSSRFRAAACKTLAAICNGGGAPLLRRLRLLEHANEVLSSEAEAKAKPMLESLVFIVEKDTDKDARVHAAQALQSIVEADIESAEIIRTKYSLPLFATWISFTTRLSPELRGSLKVILGITEDDLEEDSEEELVDDAAGSCVICQLPYRKKDQRILQCGHTFHAQCIGRWFTWKTKLNHQRSCPVCRWVAPPVPKELLPKKRTHSSSTSDLGRLARPGGTRGPTLDRSASTSHLQFFERLDSLSRSTVSISTLAPESPSRSESRISSMSGSAPSTPSAPSAQSSPMAASVASPASTPMLPEMPTFAGALARAQSPLLSPASDVRASAAVALNTVSLQAQPLSLPSATSTGDSRPLAAASDLDAATMAYRLSMRSLTLNESRTRALERSSSSAVGTAASALGNARRATTPVALARSRSSTHVGL